MCFSKPPKPEAPASAPVPPEDRPKAPELNENLTDKWAVNANRKGRNSLRIDLGSQTPEAAGSGATIPGNT